MFFRLYVLSRWAANRLTVSINRIVTVASEQLTNPTLVLNISFDKNSHVGPSTNVIMLLGTTIVCKILLMFKYLWPGSVESIRISKSIRLQNPYGFAYTYRFLDPNGWFSRSFSFYLILLVSIIVFIFKFKWYEEHYQPKNPYHHIQNNFKIENNFKIHKISVIYEF